MDPARMLKQINIDNKNTYKLTADNPHWETWDTNLSQKCSTGKAHRHPPTKVTYNNVKTLHLEGKFWEYEKLVIFSLERRYGCQVLSSCWWVGGWEGAFWKKKAALHLEAQSSFQFPSLLLPAIDTLWGKLWEKCHQGVSSCCMWRSGVANMVL